MRIDEAQRGESLLALARGALEERLLGRAANLAAEDWLFEPAATFVTLTEEGRLRGCIGSLEATRPLREDVRANALASALGDPRFAPLTGAELARVRIEVSLLSRPEPLPVASEEDAARAIRPGVDGLVLAGAGRRGTFLPQVWEQLPRPADFLRHLKRKAGLPAEGWGAGFELSRYTVTRWREAEGAA